MSKPPIETPSGRRAPAHRVLSAAATLAVSQLSLAGNAPVDFGGWNVTNGTIDTTSSCSTSGVSCTTLARDDGFVQQEVTTPAGKFYRTIVTDPSASGDPGDLGFMEENFVPVNSLVAWEINDRQAIRDPDSGFETVSQIERTPFVDNSGNVIDMFSMQIDQTMNEGPLVNDFHLTQYSAEGDPALGTVTGRALTINQELRLNDRDDPFLHMNAFDHRQRNGWKPENVDGALSVAPVTGAGAMNLGEGPVTWEDGDPLTSTWMARLDQSGETDNFAYQAFSRTDADSGSVTSTDRMAFDPPEPIDPFDWDADNLGPAPSAP